MRNVKTALILVLIVILVGVGYFFLPIEKIIGSLPFIKDLYNNTSITVNSKNGNALVRINGRDYGQTPLTIESLAPGEYELILKRVSESPDFYETRNYKVVLERNTEAILDVEIGPGDETAGYILYYSKSPQEEKSGYMTINNSADGASVSLDGEFLTRTPVSAYKLNAKEYQVRISAEGYEDTSFPIVIREGYNLNILSFQFPIPINIESE